MAAPSLHPDEKARVLQLLADPMLSYDMIAREVGCTRNVVAGLANRAGLKRAGSAQAATGRRSGHPSPDDGSIRRKLRKAQSQATEKFSLSGNAKDVAPITLPTEASALSSKFLARPTDPRKEPVGCRWIEGHTNEPDWRYCQQPRVIGKSYCPEHLMRTVRTADPEDVL